MNFEQQPTGDPRQTVLGFGCVLPRSSEPDFAEIENMLHSVGVVFRRIDVVGDGVMYLLAESELPKLPHDDRGPYLPVDEEGGHSLSVIRQAYLDLMVLPEHAPEARK